MAQPYELDTVKQQILPQIQNFAMEIEDLDLRQEAERALKSLEEYEGDPKHFIQSANEVLSNLIRLVGEYDKRRASIKILYADLDEIQLAAATPEGLVEILSCLDYPEARYIAVDLIRATSLLVQLSRGVFIGENSEMIQDRARVALRDLLSTQKGRFQADIAALYNYGAARILRAIRRDPTGTELRHMMQFERINYPALISVAKKIVNNIQQDVLRTLLQDVEHELEENMLTYFVPHEERNPDDPLIIKLAEFIDSNVLIQSRLATSLEITLKRKAVSIFTEFLKLTDDLSRLFNIYSTSLHKSDHKILIKSIDAIQTFVRSLHETCSILNLNEHANEAETEQHFLLLNLRKLFLSELRKRVSMAYGDLTKDNPLSKDARRYYENKIALYVNDFEKTVNELTVRELQTNLAAWRRWLQRIQQQFQIHKNSMRPYLKFAPDNFMALDMVIKQPKHLLNVIDSLKHRKRLNLIFKKSKSPEDVLNRLDGLYLNMNKK